LFDQLSAIPLASRIRAEVGNAGVRGVPRGPQKATRENPMGLTSRQTDVLQLLTEDLTNAEIADRVSISTRTVDHHVSAILMKLGATSRSEAAEKAREALTGV
jgi:DNA-binding NarL/FixJ family response regulator